MIVTVGWLPKSANPVHVSNVKSMGVEVLKDIPLGDGHVYLNGICYDTYNLFGEVTFSHPSIYDGEEWFASIRSEHLTN